jgi:HPt (histidine-containing phosphotransfer) domain-containing protein
MIKSESDRNTTQSDSQKEPSVNVEENMCNLTYLNEMTGGKKTLIKEIIDAFLIQVPEELMIISEAVIKEDYTTIKNVAHTMKSSLSIMGISILGPVLHHMEELGAMGMDIEKIKTLNNELNIICKQVIGELESEKHNYA